MEHSSTATPTWVPPSDVEEEVVEIWTELEDRCFTPEPGTIISETSCVKLDCYLGSISMVDCGYCRINVDNAELSVSDGDEQFVWRLSPGMAGRPHLARYDEPRALRICLSPPQHFDDTPHSTLPCFPSTALLYLL